MAQSDNRYKPKAPTAPEKMQVTIPGSRPADAIAYNRHSDQLLISDAQHTNGKVSIPMEMRKRIECHLGD